MPAQTLNCPMCGAPASSDATRCEHCGARLATVACPSCFGMIFQGAKFCSHCGAKVERTVETTDQRELCPRCHVSMNAVLVGKAHLRVCPNCQGIWVNTDLLEQICADREEQGAVLGMAAPAATPDSANVEKEIRYVPCPVCSKLMNRVNFAHCSHVIVDVCREHGTWFDKDELRRIVEFIRGGGLEQAREREINELDEQRRKLHAAQSGNAMDVPGYSGSWGSTDWHTGISAASSMIKSWLR